MAKKCSAYFYVKSENFIDETLKSLGFKVLMNTPRWVSAEASIELYSSVFKSNIIEYNVGEEIYYKWESVPVIPEILSNVKDVIFIEPIKRI